MGGREWQSDKFQTLLNEQCEVSCCGLEMFDLCVLYSICEAAVVYKFDIHIVP